MSYAEKAAALRAYAAKIGARPIEVSFLTSAGEVGVTTEVNRIVTREDLGVAVIEAADLLAAGVGIYLSARDLVQDLGRVEIRAAAYGRAEDLGRELTTAERAEISAGRCVEVARPRAQRAEGLCSVCGEAVSLTGHRTTDGRLIASCGDAFTERQWELTR